MLRSVKHDPDESAVGATALSAGARFLNVRDTGTHISSFLSPRDVGRLMMARGVDMARECAGRPESWPRHMIVPCTEYTRDRYHRAMAVQARHELQLAEEKRAEIDKRRRAHAALLPAKLKAFKEGFKTKRAQRAVMSIVNARRRRRQEQARLQELKRQHYEHAVAAGRRTLAAARGNMSLLRGVREPSLITARALEMMFTRGGCEHLNHLIDDLQTNTDALCIAAAAMEQPAMDFDDIITWSEDMERRKGAMESVLVRANSGVALPASVVHALATTDEGKLLVRDLLKYRLKGQLRRWMAESPFILDAVDAPTAAKLAKLLLPAPASGAPSTNSTAPIFSFGSTLSATAQASTSTTAPSSEFGRLPTRRA